MAVAMLVHTGIRFITEALYFKMYLRERERTSFQRLPGAFSSGVKWSELKTNHSFPLTLRFTVLYFNLPT
jgi:hypothetical protein